MKLLMEFAMQIKLPIKIKSMCKNMKVLRIVVYTQITDELVQLSIKKIHLCYERVFKNIN